jgi:PRTRC genetic system protein E
MMFTELKQLIAHRPLTITVVFLTDGRIRVNVVPQALPKDAEVNGKIKFSHKGEVAEVPESALKALATPLSLTGTPEELDAELPQALTQYSEAHVQLQQTLDQAKTQISEAVRAIDEREKAKPKSKTGGARKDDEKTVKPEEKGKPADVGLLPLWSAPSTAGVPAPVTAPVVSPSDASQSAASSPQSTQEVNT